MRKNISKICRRILDLPEVTGDTVGPEMKNFGTGSQKIYFWKVHEKLFRDFYSCFLIPCDTAALEGFKVLSVTMTSSPEVVRIKKILLIFEFLGPTDFNSKTFNKKVHLPSLRSASVLTLP